MRKSLNPSERGFNARDWQRLSQALTQAVEACLFRRLQAVLLVAEGWCIFKELLVTSFYKINFVYSLRADSPPKPMRLLKVNGLLVWEQ